MKWGLRKRMKGEIWNQKDRRVQEIIWFEKGKKKKTKEIEWKGSGEEYKYIDIFIEREIGFLKERKREGTRW
jgi:hypothetical protein